jgi:FtsX-like permease family protein
MLPGNARVKLAASYLFIDNAAAVKLPIVDATNQPYPAGTDQLRVGTLLVRTDDPVTLERVRTYLTTHASITPPVTGPQGWSINALVPATFGEIAATRQVVYDALEHIAFAAVALTLLVAGCSLAVSAGGGILERKRPFTLLRLTGTPMSSLARVVLLESVLPLVAAAVVAAGTGWALAATVATSLSDSALPFPGWPYFATTGVGLVISLAVMLLTLPLLGRLTRTQTARFE